MSVQKIQTMIRGAMLLVAATLIVAAPMVAAAATAGELLEKAIYAEETTGNLDQAIDLYEQVIAEGKQVSKTAAQAQLRLGLCYEKQGKTEAAATAFQAVIDNYPQETDLIAQARKHLPAALKLLPFPWEDGEQLQLNMKLGSGLDIGTMIYMIDAVQHEGKDAWKCSTRGLVLSGVSSYSEVVCDKATFAPIRSHWKYAMLGEADAVYADDSVEIKTVGKDEPRTVKLNSPPAWDNEQAMELFRLLPLKEGYKSSMTVVSSLGSGEVKLLLEVPKKETIEVPAGKFECYKLELNIGQTFWISTDEHRYVVRFAAGGVTADLVKIGKRQTEPQQLSTEQFSLEVPAGWHAYTPNGGLADADFKKTFLLDERAVCSAQIAVGDKAALKDEQQASTQAWTESYIKDAKRTAKDFKVVDPGVHEMEVGGRKVTAMNAEFTEMGKPMKVLGTAEFSGQWAANLRFTAPTDKFEEFRPQMDAITSSFKLK